MIDRTALLLPRLALSKRSRSDTLDEMMRHLRIGHAANGLYRALRAENGAIDQQARQVLVKLAKGLGKGGDLDAHAVAELDRCIATLMALAATDAREGGLQLLDPLLDLRHALASAAATDPERVA